MHNTISQRGANLFGALVGVILIAVAIYFQFIMGLEPCPLCILQRVVILLITLVLLFAALQNPRSVGQRIYMFFVLLFSIMGLLLAGRQLWLQVFPVQEAGACGPGLNYMVMNLPVSETIKLLFYGSADCSDVVWTFLGLSIPAWTLLCFVGYAVFALWQYQRSKK